MQFIPPFAFAPHERHQKVLIAIVTIQNRVTSVMIQDGHLKIELKISTRYRTLLYK